MSSFNLGGLSFDAFSGLSPHINKKVSACLANEGPIPPGIYYILDRKSGGFLGSLLDRLKGRSDWFALYAEDAEIDDATYCREVLRGNFRLHPKGIYGVSKGCIVIEKQHEFHFLRSMLRSVKPRAIPGSELHAYGKLAVR
ncbi:MAG: DUF2778 domain-containing protein [Aromatoleum sp.]|uniref:DUF2778 domain-containing protein n=1 Tax=Aromatoleum sp. TaxID=2307007 RepID=UPI0028943B2F|nr:DUF2778 domain-containing protein [Aromatoleum sp.]MDT3670125.1 DUF2778 domain-containing protein [Aromatoleum sp.]